MKPVAIELTRTTIPHYSVELRWLGHPLGTFEEAYIGYFLVVDEGGPDLWAPAAFWLEFAFEYANNSRTELQPVRRT